MAVDRALKAQVNRLFMPNIDRGSVESMMKAAADFPGVCLPMMGLHPTSVKPGYEAELEFIEDRLKREACVAVGETGIDLYWDKSYLKEQEAALRKQAAWALQYNLPLVLHSRKSLNELFRLLSDFKGSGLRGVFHCFPGNIPDAEKAIELGFMLGIGGVVTYKNSTMARVVEETSLEYLLLETDAPFLPPVPYRGKRNESAYIRIIAEKVADIKGVALSEVARVTTENAERLFLKQQS